MLLLRKLSAERFHLSDQMILKETFILFKSL